MDGGGMWRFLASHRSRRPTRLDDPRRGRFPSTRRYLRARAHPRLQGSVQPWPRPTRARTLPLGGRLMSLESAAVSTFTSIIVLSASSVSDVGLGPSRGRADESPLRVQGTSVNGSPLRIGGGSPLTRAHVAGSLRVALGPFASVVRLRLPSVVRSAFWAVGLLKTCRETTLSFLIPSFLIAVVLCS